MDPKKTETVQQHSSPAKNVTEKVIFIDVCKQCSKHNLSTWHDEAKYKKMFLDLKSSIEKECPDVQVFPTSDVYIKLGACEVLHGDRLLYSKIKSGLWPNAAAVAKRVAAYFKDLDAGKDVSVYSAGSEQKYIPPKKPGTSFGGTRTRFMNSSHRSTDTLSPDTRFLPKGNDHKDEQHPSEQSKRDDDHNHHAEKQDDPYEFEDANKKEEPLKHDNHETPHKQPHHEEPKVVENKTPKQEDIHKDATPKKEEIPKDDHHDAAKPEAPKTETDQAEKVEEEVKPDGEA